MINVQLAIFPPNMRSQCRPLDRGIIQQFENLYRTKLLRRVVADLDADRDYIKQSINVSNAIRWVFSSTINVQPEIMKKLFLRFGFRYRVINVPDVD